MANYYGTVKAYPDGNETGRCGHKGITTAARSWDGSVITALFTDGDGNMRVSVAVGEGSTTRGETVFVGTVDEMVRRLRGGAA